MKAVPSVSLIIVNWNGRQHLERLMPSVQELAYPRHRLETIVVDNGSSDDSVKWMRKTYPKVRTLEHGKNNYTAANNFGIRHAKGHLVGLLNNDCRVDPQWLARLSREFVRDPRVGAAGGKVLFEDGTIDSAGLQELSNFYWGDVGFFEPDQGQHDRSADRAAVSGAAMLIRRDCFDEVGWFDEDFESYYEDVDWCLRCRRRDWKIRYVPTSIAWHQLHGTAKAERVKYYAERNRLLLVAKHAPKDFPKALESAAYFLEQPSLEPLYDVVQLACRKIVQVHGPQEGSGTVPEVLDSLSRIVRGYTNVSMTALQRELGRARDALEKEKVAVYEQNTLKDGLDRSLLVLAEEVDTQQALVTQLHQQIGKQAEQINLLQAEQEDLRRESQAREAEIRRAAAMAEQQLREAAEALEGRLRRELKDIQNAEAQVREQANQLTEERVEFQNQHQALLVARDRLQQSLLEAQDRLRSMEVVREDLSSEIRSLGDVRAHLEAQREESNSRYARLEEAHQALIKDQQGLTEAHEKLLQEKHALEESHEKLLGDQQGLTEAHETLKAAYADALSQRQALDEQLAQAKKDHEIAVEDLTALRGRFYSLETEGRNLAAELSSQKKSYEILQISSGAIKDAKEQLDRGFQSLRESHKQLLADQSGLEEQHKILLEADAVNRRALEELHSAHALLVDSHRKQDAAVADLEVERMSLRGQRDAIETDLKELHSAHEQLSTAHEMLKAEHGSLLGVHGKLFHERDALKAEVQHLKRTPWNRLRGLFAKGIGGRFGGWLAARAGWVLVRLAEAEQAKNKPVTEQRRRESKMKTAQMLKLASWALLLAGGSLAAEAYALSGRTALGLAWLVGAGVATLITRMVANIGQIAFDQRKELQQVSRNIERSLYQQGALTKELRDMVRERVREERLKDKESMLT